MIKKSIINQIYQLSDSGLSSRKICAELGWPRSKKSTINDILRRRTYKDDAVGEYTKDINLDKDAVDKDWKIANLAMRLRNAQRRNTQLNAIVRGTVDPVDKFPTLLAGIKEAVENIKAEPCANESTTNKQAKILKSTFTGDLIGGGIATPENATLEVLVSDWQIGKLAQGYNKQAAKLELCEYGNKITAKLDDPAYEYDRVVVALLGDLVEDHLKHGVESAVSTDCGLAEQIQLAITHLWNYIIRPIACYGIPVEVNCVAGNHGSSQHKGMDMFKAGLYSYDYPIYKTLELLCQNTGYDNVTFNIPEGVFATTEIYGKTVLYEHGYLNGATEKSMSDQMRMRGQQVKKYIEYFRIGDMHHVVSYDCGKMVLNGAFFGADNEGTEYSGVMGFSAIPAQVMMVHTESCGNGNTVKEFIPVQFR